MTEILIGLFITSLVLATFWLIGTVIAYWKKEYLRNTDKVSIGFVLSFMALAAVFFLYGVGKFVLVLLK